MLYVDYNFEVKDGVITFDKELSGEEFLQRSGLVEGQICLLYTSPSPRDATLSRMPSSA